MEKKKEKKGMSESFMLGGRFCEMFDFFFFFFFSPQWNLQSSLFAYLGTRHRFAPLVRYEAFLAIYRSNGVCIFRANNRISGISEERLRPFASLESLDLSSNKIVEIKTSSFPALPLKNL